MKKPAVIRTLAFVLAIAAILMGTFAVTTATARPKDCPYCCMNAPYPPYHVCWHCRP